MKEISNQVACLGNDVLRPAKLIAFLRALAHFVAGVQKC